MTSCVSVPTKQQLLSSLGSGCDSVGRAVASNPEIRSLNPVIGKKLYWTFAYCQLYWKDENREKEVGNSPIFKNKCRVLQSDNN